MGQNNYKVGQPKNDKVGQKNYNVGQLLQSGAKNHKVGQVLQSGAQQYIKQFTQQERHLFVLFCSLLLVSVPKYMTQTILRYEFIHFVTSKAIVIY